MGHGSGAVSLWNLETGRRTSLFLHGRNVSCLCFTPDGQTLASGGFDKSVSIWSVESRHSAELYVGRLAGGRSALAVAPEGRTVAVLGTSDSLNSVKLWDVSTGRVDDLLGHQDKVTSAAFSPDGRILASGSYDYTVKIWNVASRQELATLADHTHGVISVAFSPDGKSLASAGNYGQLRLTGRP
jgi:WD40 repeat protein